MIEGKKVVAQPVYTKDNPMPFEEALKRFAPKTIIRTLEIHKEDGTVCVLPFCKEEHDVYRVTYERVSVVRRMV